MYFKYYVTREKKITQYIIYFLYLKQK